MKKGPDNFAERVKPVIRHSGPFCVAEFECQGCPRLASLLDGECRRCVLEGLATVEPVQRVLLKKSYHRVYSTPKLSQLAKRIASAELNQELLSKVRTDPHDLRLLDKAGLKEVRFLVEQWGLEAKNYEEVFNCFIKPFFIRGLWLGSKYPTKLVETYALEGGGTVRIYEQIGASSFFYDLDLPEFRLPPRLVRLMYVAYHQGIEKVPEDIDLARSEDVERFLERLYLERMLRLSEEFTREELARAAKLLVRWPKYGVFEPLSRDDFLTDIGVEPPAELQPLMVEHTVWGRCETGIYLETSELFGFTDALASREGKRFDEHHPHLDAEIPELGMRIFATQTAGLSLSIRRRRRKPWTQPLFIHLRTLSPLASSFLSNILRLGASAAIIGAMGTAKTSQLETYLPEVGRSNKVVIFQDTEELHIQDFVLQGYRVTDVRVRKPAEMEKLVEAFLRGGPAYWFFSEVRQREAIRPAVGAAARQGQPVVLSLHARSTEELMVILTQQMGLSEAEVRFLDLIIHCAKFETRRGVVRRITEITEVRKDGNKVTLFVDDRTSDALRSRILRGSPSVIRKLDSKESCELEPSDQRELELVPPEEGGSYLLFHAAKKLGLDEEELLQRLLAETFMKSTLVRFARERDLNYLELPLVTAASDYYFSLLREEVDPFPRWRKWLCG